MSETRTQSWQVRTDKDLKNLGKLKETNYVSVLDSVDAELDYPLKLSASFPTADGKLNFSNSSVTQADGAKKVLPPVKKQVFSLSANPFIDFQLQEVSEAGDFDIAWPTTNTVGSFRRVGFTLIGSGQIKALFSDEVTDAADLPNPGTLMVNGGLPLGFVDLECTDEDGFFKSIGASTPVISNSTIYRFGAGAGGGSGTGDTTGFVTDLKLRLYDSFYQHVTPVEFAAVEAALTESSNGVFDLVDAVYRLNLGQFFLSKNLFGSEFNASSDDHRQTEIWVEWFDSASVDANAVVQVALDGINFETVEMVRQGLSTRFIGSKLPTEPASADLHTAAVGGDSELGAVTNQVVSKSIVVVGKQAVREIKLYVTKTGALTGSLIVSLKNEDGDVLFSKIVSATSLVAGANILTLNGFKSVLPAGNYTIDIETDAAYKAEYVSGTMDYAVNDRHEVRGYNYDLRVRVTASSSERKLKAIGMFYDEQVGNVASGEVLQDRKIFSGDLNQNTFQVTKFLPNPYHLKVYDIFAGQVYRYPAFYCDGQNVVFPAGTFNIPGVTLNLLFDQSEGTGFDHSDFNASIIAANGLGSMDDALDLSQPGKGPIVRRLGDGKRRMIYLDESDNIQIKELE